MSKKTGFYSRLPPSPTPAASANTRLCSQGQGSPVGANRRVSVRPAVL
ncbi:hypothetical protein GO988_12300 [Hymenobacter sp. HMF4947]|uniref:Uncharacterized protein n=1 Tax=Hymenobacter ginkgonis TaxID=2682976 RepID=A0A7K1TFD2_9BACT|nr:hypothetical protein [Hymenobacter ginkgonis]MVN77108.1 hypothetical protein [Hymenobacter ginkgonis]